MKLESKGNKSYAGLFYVSVLLILCIVIIGYFVCTFKRNNLEALHHSKADSQWLFTATKHKQKFTTDILDRIANAIVTYEQSDGYCRPLSGSQLVKQPNCYNTQMIRDPWDREILFDFSMGLILSFGADGQAGGVGINEDLVKRYLPDLTLDRVQLDGPWGRPVEGNEIVITMTKPFAVIDSDAVEQNLQLLFNIGTKDLSSLNRADSVSFEEINSRGKIAPNWKAGSSQSRYHAPIDRILSLYNDVNTSGDEVQYITPTMAINFDLSHVSWTGSSQYGITETSVPGGLMTSTIYGPGVSEFYRPVVPVPLYNGENRGIRIEKF